MTTTPDTPIDSEQLADEAAPLDALLVDAALGPLVRFAPNLSTAKFAFGLARRPLTTGRRLGSLAAELARIGVGTSVLAPPKRDRRFTDPAWTENWLLRRIVQAYLAAGMTAEELVGDTALDWRDDKRVRFLVENLEEALSPSNVPLVNPASVKAAIDTAGFNFVRGGISLLRDMAAKPRIPEMVDTSSFEVGRNIAVTPGAVVRRTELVELIQYRPQTERVREVPLLIVPPTINKYYAMDLAPGRSIVEYLVQGGQQVFVISWRNPDARLADRGLDAYVQAVLDALDAVQRVCGTDQLLPPTWPRPAATASWRRSACLSPCSTPCRPAPWVPSLTGSSRRPRRRCRDAAVTWTAGTWPRCSPGCAPATWSGTTG